MRTLRWVALVIVLALSIVTAISPVLFDSTPWDVLTSGAPFLYMAAGLVVMAKRPWHQIGWLLILLGLGFGMTSLPATPSRLGPGWHPWFTWIGGSWGGYFGFLVMVALLVGFPDGLSHRPEKDRRIGRWVTGAVALLTLLSAMSDPIEYSGTDGSASFPNPLVVGVVPKPVNDFGYVPVILTIVGCVAWLWRRMRRAEGLERRRYELILYTFSLLMVGLVLGVTLSEIIGDAAWAGAIFGWFALPVAFAYAVIRHGLYGVDRLVRRTVTYSAVAIVVAAVYAIPVVSLPAILGETNDLVIAGSTLAAAAAFNPVRRRIQRAVDQRFDRARYDAEREVDLFTARLTDEVALGTVVDDLWGVLQKTVAPSIAAIWLRRPEDDREAS